MLLLQKHNHLFISLLFKNSLTADSSETINKYANNKLITCVGVSFFNLYSYPEDNTLFMF